MKIIEAMKRVKMNEAKVVDLRVRINSACANLSHETNQYGDNDTVREKVAGWVQACLDISRENIRLLTAIQRTNLQTYVTIELGDGVSASKNIAEWVWRRRTYAKFDLDTISVLNTRNLKEGLLPSSQGGEPVKIEIVRHFDVNERDSKRLMFTNEPHLIDAALEVVNATTELIES